MNEKVEILFNNLKTENRKRAKRTKIIVTICVLISFACSCIAIRCEKDFESKKSEIFLLKQNQKDEIAKMQNKINKANFDREKIKDTADLQEETIKDLKNQIKNLKK